MELQVNKTYSLGKGKIKILEITETEVKSEYKGNEYISHKQALIDLLKKNQ
jgi:hypothetical protein